MAFHGLQVLQGEPGYYTLRHKEHTSSLHAHAATHAHRPTSTRTHLISRAHMPHTCHQQLCVPIAAGRSIVQLCCLPDPPLREDNFVLSNKSLRRGQILYQPILPHCTKLQLGCASAASSRGQATPPGGAQSEGKLDGYSCRFRSWLGGEGLAVAFTEQYGGAGSRRTSDLLGCACGVHGIVQCCKIFSKACGKHMRRLACLLRAARTLCCRHCQYSASRV